MQYSIPNPEKSFAQLLADSAKTYYKHFTALTMPLLVPVALQVVPIYAAYYLSITLGSLSIQNPDAFYANPVFTILAALLIGLVAAILFCKGLWQWLIYLGALNINAVQCLNNHPLDAKGAYKEFSQKVWPYLMYLKLYFWLPLIPFILAFVLMIIFFIAFPQQAQDIVNQLNATDMLTKMAQIIGFFIVAGVLTIVPMLIIIVLLSLGVQVVAFEEVTLNPLPIAKKSFSLVSKVPAQTVILLIVLCLLTTVVVPYLLLSVFEITGLMGLIDGFHQWYVDNYLSNSQASMQMMKLYQDLYASMGREFSTAEIAHSLSEQVIFYITPCLMLPLGTIACTMLYFKARTKIEQKEQS